MDSTHFISHTFHGGKPHKQKPKTFRATDTNNLCQFIHLSNLLSAATNRVYQRKAEQADTVSEPSASLFVLHTLPVCEVFTCNCLHGGEQRKFLSSPQPARPSLPASHRAPIHQSQPNTFPELSVWLHTFIPPLVQLRKSQNCMLAVGTQRTEPLHACIWSCSVSPLPSCTVCCHL